MTSGSPAQLPASEGPGRYSFETACDYLKGQLAALGADQQVTLVIHDWGSALGFHWTRLHPQQVRGIAYMEGIVMPLPSWNDWPDGARGIFQGFLSAKGEDLILKRNLFIEALLPPTARTRCASTRAARPSPSAGPPAACARR